MTRLLQDLRFGLRSFGKARGFTAVAVLVLGLGIGANSALFTLVNSMLLRPLTPRDAILYGVYSHDRTRPDSYRAFSYPNYADLRGHSEIFDGLLAHTFAMVGVPAGDRMTRTFVALVSSNYFDILGVKLAVGRPFTLQEERVRALPRVQEASLASSVPFGDTHEGARMERVASRSAEQGGREPEFRIASAGYFASLGLKGVRGREFTRAEEESPGAAPVAIVDEALARHLFGTENPIGQMIRFAPNPERPDPARILAMQIVGIAPPVREELTSRGTTPHIYVPMGRHYRSNMYLHIRTAPRADMASMLNTVRSEIRASNARLPVLDLMTMQGFHDRSLELWVLKAGGEMFTLLGLLALTLAVVGVYGLKAYMVSRRTREIGIRMALGAEPRDVLWMMLRDGLALTGAGLGVGIPLAALMSLALSKVLYDAVPFDPVVFAIAPAVLAATALVASVLPARSATRVAPVRALKSE